VRGLVVSGNPRALSEEESEALWASASESIDLQSKAQPFEMLERDNAHERGLAKNVQKAAKEAVHLAGRLNKLSEFLAKIDKQRRGGPLARWLWHHTPEGQAALADAYAGRPQNPPPWEQKPKGGTAVVAEIIAKAFDKNVAGTLGEEAARSKARKGGRPRAIRFNAMCLQLAKEGRSDRQIAEVLLMASLASGTLAEVEERVRVVLNRYEGSEKSVHALIEPLATIQGIEDKERRRFFRGRRLPERIGGPESTK
jgi:hypothetical protein